MMSCLFAAHVRVARSISGVHAGVVLSLQHIVQPRGIRVIRQVVGPAQASLAHQHQFAQMPSPIGASIVQSLQAGLIR